MKKQIFSLIVLGGILTAFSIPVFGQKTVPVKFAKGKTSTEIKSTGSVTFLANIRKGQKFNAIAINESNCDSKMSGLMDVVYKGVPGEEESGYGAFYNNFKGTADITGTYRFKITAAKCASYRFFISIE